MATTQNIRWYMTEAVATALRSKTLAITAERDGRGDTQYEPADVVAFRTIKKAHDLAFKGGRVAEELGVPWAVVQDRLGLRVWPWALAAVVAGVPFDWQGTAGIEAAEKAIAEIEAAFGPVRRKIAA